MMLRTSLFDGDQDESFQAINDSLSCDIHLFFQDVEQSKAYALALAEAGVLDEAESGKLRDGLNAVAEEMEAGDLEILPADEDVHMLIERRLTELVGEAGEKLHTGRSRNDQAVTDLRMFVMTACDVMSGAIADLMEALLDQAEEAGEAALPGYTHTQRAQPVLLAHHLLAHFHALARDRERLISCRERSDILPLGSGALAGSGIPLDRDLLARELGFTKISGNSMDAVASRDFVLEFMSTAAILMVNLSRMAEELVLWSSSEFGYVALADGFTSTSSMMPQKKNPDAAELVRAKCGRAIGDLAGLLATLKGLPLTYNKDLQEDKEALFDSVETLALCLPAMTGMLASLRFNASRMAEACSDTFLLATDLADRLALTGLPFRRAHEVTAAAVRLCREAGKELTGLTASELSSIEPKADPAALEGLDLKSSLAARDLPGGTAPSRVKAALKAARTALESIIG